MSRRSRFWREAYDSYWRYSMAIGTPINIYSCPNRNFQSPNSTTSLLAQHHCPIIMLLNIDNAVRSRNLTVWSEGTKGAGKYWNGK